MRRNVGATIAAREQPGGREHWNTLSAQTPALPGLRGEHSGVPPPWCPAPRVSRPLGPLQYVILSVAGAACAAVAAGATGTARAASAGADARAEPMHCEPCITKTSSPALIEES